jgi:thiol-disulfide isomerase/thioredoxin
MKKSIAVILCMLMLLSAGCMLPGPHTEPEPIETQAPEPVVTDAPAEPAEPAEPQGGAFNTEMIFSGTTLDGEPIDHTIFENYDLIIVNCWAEWCGPCVGELPEIERIHQEYPNVLILGVLVGTNSVEAAKETLSECGVTYPALEPVGGLIALSQRSMYIPATYFFDRNGDEVGGEVIGSMDYDQWKATVDNLLG